MTYYQNLVCHLTMGDEKTLDAIIARATGNPSAGIGCPPHHEEPRVWLEDCDPDLASIIQYFLHRPGYVEDQTMNTTAQDAYASAHAEALALVDLIRKQIEDMPAPSEKTNWGHVGDMNMTVTLLQRILNPGVD